MIFTDFFWADFWILGIIALIVGHSLILMRQNRWIAIEPLNAFWVGITVVYILQAIKYESVLNYWHTRGVYEEGLFWIFFGLFWVVVGYEMRWGVTLGLRMPVVGKKITPHRLVLCSWMFIGAGLLGYAYLIASAGSLSAWLAVPRGGTDWQAVIGYGAQLAGLLPIGVILLVFQAQIHSSSFFKKMMVYAFAFLMLLWFFYLGSRSRTITFTILLFAATYLPKRKNPKILFCVVAVFLIFIATNFQQHYRYNFYNLSFNLENIDLSEAYDKIMPSFLGGNDKISFRDVSRGLELNCVLSVVELVPRYVDYNYGYGFLELLTRPIPRLIWPDKIYPNMESVQGVLKNANLSDSYVTDRKILMGPAFTYIGHWYYVGGPIALIIFGLITGFLFRAIKTYYESNIESQSVPVFYALLISIGFSDAAGTPFNWIFTLPFVLIPFWFVMRYCRES